MTARKPKQAQRKYHNFRNEHGEFAALPPEARAKLEAMCDKPGFTVVGVIRGEVPLNLDYPFVADAGAPPYCDAIYRPERKGWLERALHWFTWHRSRA